MAAKRATKRQSRKPGKRRETTNRIEKVSTKLVIDALDGMATKVVKIREDIARLPPGQQGTATNTATLRSIQRTLHQLDAFKGLVATTLCCKEQIQNCEFEIDE